MLVSQTLGIDARCARMVVFATSARGFQIVDGCGAGEWVEGKAEMEESG